MSWQLDPLVERQVQGLLQDLADVPWLLSRLVVVVPEDLLKLCVLPAHIDRLAAVVGVCLLDLFLLLLGPLCVLGLPDLLVGLILSLPLDRTQVLLLLHLITVLLAQLQRLLHRRLSLGRVLRRLHGRGFFEALFAEGHVGGLALAEYTHRAQFLLLLLLLALLFVVKVGGCLAGVSGGGVVVAEGMGFLGLHIEIMIA